MMFFDLKIPTSPGNALCNVSRSEVDLQKKEKRLSPLLHLHTTALLRASSIRNRFLMVWRCYRSDDLFSVLKIDLAAGDITETDARRSGDSLAGRIERL